MASTTDPEWLWRYNSHNDCAMAREAADLARALVLARYDASDDPQGFGNSTSAVISILLGDLGDLLEQPDRDEGPLLAYLLQHLAALAGLTLDLLAADLAHVSDVRVAHDAAAMERILDRLSASRVVTEP